MSTAETGLATIGQIALMFRDLPKAVQFYRDTLGMKFLFEVPGMAFFQCGSVRLLLGKPEKPEFDHPASIIYYSVDDLHAMHALLESRGVQFESKPHRVAKMPDHELWMAFFRDCEGNLLALMSEVRLEGRPL